VAVSGGYAFVAYDNPGLVVYDVSDPRSVEQVTRLAIPGDAWGLEHVGDYLFITTWGVPYALTVIDISDPLQPAVASTLPLTGWPRGIAVDGGYAYIANHLTGLEVVDVRDPSQPKLVGGNAAFSGRSVAVGGDNVFVAAYDGGLVVLDRFGLDRDADGLPDRVETGTGIWSGPDDRGTDPDKPDSDLDGLPDATENPETGAGGALQAGTDPNRSDSDDDGQPDGTEIVAAGTDPLDPQSAFRILGFGPGPPGLLTVRFTSQSGIRYTVWEGPFPGQAAALPLGFVAGSAVVSEFSFPATPTFTERFFWVETW
jgi:hypothetical protein